MIGSGAELIAWHEDARAHTLALIGDLDGPRLLGPMLAIVNPPLWELGHVAWFHERWAWRHLRGRAPLRADGDRLYDSATVAHDTRWRLPLPSLLETHDYARTILERLLVELEGSPPIPDAVYFHRLGVLHEDMHGEAFAYTRQTLGYTPPVLAVAPAPAAVAGWRGGDAEVPGGVFRLGAEPGDGFVFDNEKWAHPVTLAPFRIARAAVTGGEFAGFVGAGGYTRRDFWCDAGWAWREAARAEHPVYWRPAGGGWEERVYDRWQPLRIDHPVIHVCWYEADAYCRWAGRRLPSEAEWEAAAAGVPDAGGTRLSSTKRAHPWGECAPTAAHANLDARHGGTIPVSALPDGDSAFGCRQLYGNVWEWTATDFAPYPGFVVDPYKEYSVPWFHTHKVLRGGCWATRARLLRNTWRNFATPDRRDVFGGFRTCAL
jgi:iron(II)-dependent oxidoreductase